MTANSSNSNSNSGSSGACDSRVDLGLLRKAMKALLEYHDKSSDKNALLGNEKTIQVQFGLDRIPQNPSTKPRPNPIPHPLYKVDHDDSSNNNNNKTTRSEVAEPSVCLMVKDDSKCWVQSMLNEFPKQLHFVKKVLTLTMLWKQHARYDQQRSLLHQFDVFMADDRILPMLSPALGRSFHNSKKLPIPIDLTRKSTFPIAVVKALRVTHMFVSRGTCISIRAGNTSMDLECLVENVGAICENAGVRIPRCWANICSISIKTTDSTALPIYHKLPKNSWKWPNNVGLPDRKEVEQKKKDGENEKLKKSIQADAIKMTEVSADPNIKNTLIRKDWRSSWA